MRRILSHKVRSSALQFALFTSILIAILLGSLVLYVYTFTHFKEESKSAIENIGLADSAMNYLLNKSEIVTDTIHIESLERENQAVRVATLQWGMFQKAFAGTTHRKKNFVRVALIGSKIDSQGAPTLFLEDSFSPLSLVGDTKITGNAWLPSQGAKAGNIAGNGYYGKQLIYGAIKKSELRLPKINKQLYDGLWGYLKNEPASNESILKLQSETFNSFKAKTKGYYSSGKIVLENCKLTGNIIIRSNQSIQVRRSAILKDLILIAPEIVIEDNCNGNFQAFASKNISVGKLCKLAYPSAMVLLQDNLDAPNPIVRTEFENRITIGGETIIKGVVCYLQTNDLPNFKTQLLLEKSAIVKGEIYCQGNFELRGLVSGCVFTRKFISNVAGSIYINHIYGGAIENENVPDFYSGVLLEDDDKTIAQWLY